MDLISDVAYDAYFFFLTRMQLPTVSVMMTDDEPGLLTDELIDFISNDSPLYHYKPLTDSISQPDSYFSHTGSLVLYKTLCHSLERALSST